MIVSPWILASVALNFLIERLTRRFTNPLVKLALILGLNIAAATLASQNLKHLSPGGKVPTENALQIGSMLGFFGFWMWASYLDDDLDHIEPADHPA